MSPHHSFALWKFRRAFFIPGTRQVRLRCLFFNDSANASFFVCHESYGEMTIYRLMPCIGYMTLETLIHLLSAPLRVIDRLPKKLTNAHSERRDYGRNRKDADSEASQEWHGPSYHSEVYKAADHQHSLLCRQGNSSGYTCDPDDSRPKRRGG